MVIEKDFTFDSSHFLPYVSETHKCRRLHGHTYHVTIALSGETHPTMGWIQDFSEIKNLASPLIENLDHRLLNSIPGLENPTAEVIAKYIFHELKLILPQLAYVRLCETPTSRVIYHGD